MKFSILQENLNKGLNIINRFIVSKSQLPILNNVLIKTDQGRIKLSATNLEIGINLWLGGKIEEEGEVCIPAKILTEYISSLPPQKINLSTNKNILNINSDSYQANFISLPTSEFPIIPTLNKKPKIILTTKELSLAIPQVAFASSQDESRPVLTGVLIQIKKDSLTLAATDGYRLSIKKIKDLKGLEKITEKQKELLIPARALIEVEKIINEDDGKSQLGLTITPENNQVIFSTPEAEIISRLIEGKLPDFRKIIPEKNSTKTIIETESLFQAIRAAAIFARESANIVKFDIKDSKIEIRANSPQIGENKIQLNIKQEGEGGKIAFNYRYLLDFLNTVNSELVTFEMNDSLSPGVFKPTNDSSYLHIIMPIRIQE